MLHWNARDHILIARYLAKWGVILAPVAVSTGSICALFLWSLDRVTNYRLDHPWILFLLPVAGMVTGALYHWFGRSVEGGNNLLVDEIHEPGGGVPARIVPLILVTTVEAHLFGASVGREGTAVQMGGGVAAAVGRWLRLSPADVRVLLMAGIAAGFGAVFGTPLAGAVFAMEVLAIGRMEYSALIPVLYAALLADFTTAEWGAHHTAYHVELAGRTPGLPFDWVLMLKVVAAGVAFGLAALIFAEAAHTSRRIFLASVRSPYLRPAIGGLITIGLVYLLGTRDYLGLGVTAREAGSTSIVSAFHEGGAGWLSWWWKILFTAVALGSGFKGGEVTPLFFIGSTLGNRLAVILGGPADLFAGLGFVAVFAGAANTPLACTLMGIELFGAGPAVYLATACFVAYLVSGHSGIYLSQRVATPKVEVDGFEAGSQLREVRESHPNVAGMVRERFWRR
ncbi:MAG: voltage-gated chloride channel family protein [Dehalococcoidia bacterium]|nr:voltage-gated chloride channel family protein [Dehalococcoidia bacterium]